MPDDNNPLLLRNLPMYRCCEHCLPAYCPDGLGHYVWCPQKFCVQGQELVGGSGIN